MIAERTVREALVRVRAGWGDAQRSRSGSSAAVDALAGELVSFTADLIAIPTVNPPGEAYEPCARHIGDTLRGFGFETQYYTADGLPEHRPTTRASTSSGSGGGGGRGPACT